MKKLLILFIVLIMSGCATTDVSTLETNGYWTCEHIPSFTDRTLSFKEEDIQRTTIMECPEILQRNGECPPYIRIVTLEGDTVWLTQDEWENYVCTFVGRKNDET